MKGKAIIPLVLGLCVGLVAVKLLVDTLKKAQASSAARNTVFAVQAKQDIDAYTEIKPEMVELIDTPDNKFAPAKDRIDKIELVVGRVTAKAIPQFSPVLSSMLAPDGTQAGMEGRIPPGFRAVSVEIDEVTGVAYQMKPGDWVDVIMVMDIEGSGSRRSKETVAEVILQHVQVAAIGQATSGKPGEGASKVKAAKSATLLISEEEVPKLHLAATRGKITLAMRGDDDVKLTVKGASSNSKDLFSSIPALQEPQLVVPPVAKPSFDPNSSLLAAAAKMFNDKKPAQQASPEEDPFGVTIFRGSTVESYPSSVEHIVFENSHSSKILGVADGPVSKASALQAGKGKMKQQNSTTPAGRAQLGAEDFEAGPQ